MNVRNFPAALLALAAVRLAAGPQPRSKAADCAELDAATPQQLVEYLRGDRPSLRQACVVYAINKLGVEGYAPATGVLVTYLDYRGPDDPQRVRTGVVLHAWWPIYPAADALFLIGKPAIPDLIGAIAGSDTPDLVRKSAIHVLGNIQRDEPSRAVATLVSASKATKDAGASQRLLDAAKEAVVQCAADTRYRCLDALYAK